MISIFEKAKKDIVKEEVKVEKETVEEKKKKLTPEQEELLITIIVILVSVIAGIFLGKLLYDAVI